MFQGWWALAKQDELISDLLGEDQGERDHSLRAKSLRRAVEPVTPRTLTPDEWSDWYAMHGTPTEHEPATVPPPRATSMMTRIKLWLAGKGRTRDE